MRKKIQSVILKVRVFQGVVGKHEQKCYAWAGTKGFEARKPDAMLLNHAEIP